MLYVVLRYQRVGDWCSGLIYRRGERGMLDSWAVAGQLKLGLLIVGLRFRIVASNMYIICCGCEYMLQVSVKVYESLRNSCFTLLLPI